MSGTSLTALTVFGAGLASFFSPCVVPLLPAYVSFLTGFRVEELQRGQYSKGLAFKRGIGFVAGFSLVFICLGASASWVGKFVFTNRSILTHVGGAVVFVGGAYLAGLMPLRFLAREKRIAFVPAGAGGFAAVGLGMAFAAGWTPCVGPVLSAVLVFAASSGTTGSGIFLLAVYSLGLAVPFLAASVGIEALLPLLQKTGRFLPWVSKASGLVLMLLGLMLFFDRLG